MIQNAGKKIFSKKSSRRRRLSSMIIRSTKVHGKKAPFEKKKEDCVKTK